MAHHCITSLLLLLLCNNKKVTTPMNRTHDRSSIATLPYMNAKPVGPSRPKKKNVFYSIHTNLVITFLERTSANSDARSGILINHHFLLPQCSTTTTNIKNTHHRLIATAASLLSPQMAPTIHIHRPQPPQQQQCRNTMSPNEPMLATST